LKILPDKFQGIDVLEDVFENGVINDTSGIGDSCESVHAETDDQEGGLKRNEDSFTVEGRPCITSRIFFYSSRS
jgi:hypothetical protein